MKPGDTLVVEAGELDVLLGALRLRGYTLLGPTVRDGAIVLGEIGGTADLPRGVSDEQEGGRYRLRSSTLGGAPPPNGSPTSGGKRTLFGYAVSPHSWKRYLHPPALVRWRARRDDGGFVAEPETTTPARYAFVGVRPCELCAIRVQDRVFLGGPFVDPAYRSRRESYFLLAVSCGFPGGTCFCASMGTGPKAGPGSDLGLTELVGEGRHDLVVEVGSERGAEIAEAVPHRPAEAADLEAVRAVLAEAEAHMGRSLRTDGLKDLLYRRYEDPRWDEVARRCLGCANCTMVCPTCFCATVEDETDLAGASTERRRIWDSCFSQEFSYVHGGSVRTSGGARYRQWITHKLATWHDQFGLSGCVGCGRCITWCPVGIDITEEARAVRQGEAQGG